MIFEEEKAIEIIEKYGLPKKQLAIWRSSNHIPNKYNKKDYSVYTDMIYQQDNLIFSQVAKIIQTRKLKQSVLNDICGFSKNKLNRVVQQEGMLSYDEYIRLIEECNKIKEFTVKAYDALKFQNKELLDLFFSLEAINVMAICENNNVLYTKINQSKNSAKKNFPFEYLEDLDRCMYTFLLEIKLLIVYLRFRAEFTFLLNKK